MQQAASATEEMSRNHQLIPGQRFCPMEDELLLFYLKPMLSGENVPGRNKVVFDCDLYGDQEPWEIWNDYKTKRPHDLRLHKDLYFFTQHKKIKSTDKRIRRTVGSGTWKGNDSGKPIKSLETGRVIGSKKRFTYENEGSEHHKCWILHEFYLDRSLRDKNVKVQDYVLCQLRKNGEPETKMEKKRKQREDQEEEVLEDNDACDDQEQSNTEQEELLDEPQAKRQRTESSAPPVAMPSEEEVDAFIAQIEETVPCVEEDDNSPPTSEAEAVGIQDVEDGGLQQLACEVQSNPSFVRLLEDGFVMDDEVVQGIVNYVEREEQDPAGSNNACVGLIDFQDGDIPDYMNTISFDPEENSFFSSEMLSSSWIGQRQEIN